METENYFVEIVQDKDKSVVRRVGPSSKRRAEKIEDGMSINLNHADFFTRIVEDKNVEENQTNN